MSGLSRFGIPDACALGDNLMRDTLTTKEIGVLPLLVAGLPFLAGFGAALLSLLTVYFGIVSTNTELPLGGLEIVSIGEGDLIFCEASSYRRIQVYSPEGQFIRAIKVRSKIHKFYVNNQGIVRVKGTNSVGSYSVDGRFLGKTADTSRTRDEFANIPEYVFMDQQGNTYSVARNYWNFARVVRTTPDGQRTVVVSQPWYL